MQQWKTGVGKVELGGTGWRLSSKPRACGSSRAAPLQWTTANALPSPQCIGQLPVSHCRRGSELLKTLEPCFNRKFKTLKSGL